MVMQLQRKKEYLQCKKTKHKISWNTDSNLPSIQGYSLPETIATGLKLYQSLISLDGSPIGAINPYTMELLINPDCNLDPMLNGRIVGYFSENFTGYSRIVTKTDYKYGTITEVSQSVGQRLREYIGISHICKQAEQIILENYWEYWYLECASRSKITKLVEKFRKVHPSFLGEHTKDFRNYGSPSHKAETRLLWMGVTNYDVIRYPMYLMKPNQA
jgi:hypothetical protein